MKNKGGHERVLLISNSTLYGSGYLDHAESEIRNFLRGGETFSFFRTRYTTAMRTLQWPKNASENEVRA